LQEKTGGIVYKHPMDKILTVIPAYNEEKNIAGVIGEIKKSFPNTDIVVINDGSEDKTKKCVQAAGAKLINLPYNMGYGAALQTGFKYAIKNKYNYVIQIDGDGQHDPADISRLLEPLFLGEADVVIGSRFLGEKKYKAPFLRLLGMMVFSFLASILTGQKITDPTSGYQALNLNGTRFYASEYYPVDFPDADVIIMLHRAGLKVKEVPITMYQSPENKSMHAGLKPVYYIFKMFLSIFLTLLRNDTFEKETFKSREF
jgi:glycosyltransferase involved in cell wall biosynthesis